MDDRPLKLLERAPDAVRPALKALAEHAGALAAAADEDLQFEFGKEHIAFIASCNQFMRIHHRGDHAGTVELPPASGATGGPAMSAIFQMFQWTSLPAEDVRPEHVDAAFNEAASRG